MTYIDDPRYGWDDWIKVEKKNVLPSPRTVTAALLHAFYSEDQPRDENGRWGSGGGTSDTDGETFDADAFLKEHPREPGEEVFVWQGRVVQDLPPDQQSEVLFKCRENYPPCARVLVGIENWCLTNGLPLPPDDLDEWKVDLEEADEVAEYFETHDDQSDDPAVIAAYEDFKEQSEAQWDFMTRSPEEGGMGITVTFTDEVDPYESAQAQRDDLENNAHITIQSGLGGAHEATMTQDEYDRFRAVHDVFGHAGVGGGFDRHGEYQAWLMHSAMYTGAGRDAMSTEYHGVNSALWSGDPTDKGGTGKSILLPPEYSIPLWER